MEHAGMAAELKERVANYDCGSSNKKATAVVLKKRLLDEEEKTDGRGRLKKFRSIAYIYKITRPVTASVRNPRQKLMKITNRGAIDPSGLQHHRWRDQLDLQRSG